MENIIFNRHILSRSLQSKAVLRCSGLSTFRDLPSPSLETLSFSKFQNSKKRVIFSLPPSFHYLKVIYIRSPPPTPNHYNNGCWSNCCKGLQHFEFPQHCSGALVVNMFVFNIIPDLLQQIVAPSIVVVLSIS